MINRELVRVLLVERCEATAKSLRSLLQQHSSDSIALDWAQTRPAALNMLLVSNYDVYLFALPFIIEEDSDLLSEINPLDDFAPVIALVDTPESGRRALERGAADWWVAESLSLEQLERSLRLTLENSRLKNQLACFHCDRQVAEETWQENEWAFQVHEERLHGILDSLNDVVWSFDPRNNKLLYLNSAVESVYGYTVNDFIKDFSLWRSRIHPDDRRRVEACDTLANSPTDPIATTDNSFDIDYRILHKDGGLRWLREKTHVIYNSNGTAIRRNSIASDITQHKQAQERLQQQMERERLLAQLDRDIHCSLDLAEILETTVCEVRKLLGCDRAAIACITATESGAIYCEATADGIPKVLDSLTDRKFLQTIYEQHQSGGTALTSRRDGATTAPTLRQYLEKIGVQSQLLVPIFQQETLWGLLVAHQCQPLRDWQGWEIELLQQLAARAAIAIYQAQLLEQQTRYARDLARSNQDLEKFAYIASHDLQEPLRAAISFAQLLEREYREVLEPEAQEYIDFIIDGATRMRQLIQALLALSRVGTRGKPFAPVDCQHALALALDNLKIAIAESNAVIDCDSLPILMADESQLVQLFQNTIANALKFRSEREPTIRIRAVAEAATAPETQPQKPSYWRFSVEDNGIGIDAQYRDRIFEIFQRLHTREQYEGTGIGLAICQKIVQRHGGEIWVESTPGRGSTFYFTLCEETRAWNE